MLCTHRNSIQFNSIQLYSAFYRLMAPYSKQNKGKLQLYDHFQTYFCCPHYERCGDHALLLCCARM